MTCSTRFVIPLAATLSLCASACSDDTTTADDQSADADADTGDSNDDADTGEPVPEPELGGPAMGVSIVAVEANQGTAVQLTEGDTWVAPNERNAYLTRDRDTLIRFQHVIDDPDAWFARDLTGFLHVYPADGGEEIIRERKLFVAGDSDIRDIATNFYFSLLASEAKPGARFWLELRESDDSIDVSSLSEGLTTAPAEPELIGFEDTPLEFKVMIVPVDYQWVDPPRYPDITEEDIQIFYDALLQQNPVQTIDIQIREQPLVWNNQLTNLGALLGPTRALKIDDGAPSNVYYHALVDVGGSGVNMVAGIANLADASMNDGDRRVAATVYYKQYDPGDEETGEEPVTYPPTGSARTWVHELGHNQGLSHVYCPGGNSAGDDPSYPYMDGKIGVHGFGIRDFHMYTPGAAHDYMSYCGNSWVSDWTWNKTFLRIQTLTSWDYETPPAPPPETTQILVGMLFADGSEDWWVYEAAAPSARSTTQALEYWREGELVAMEYAEVSMLSDEQTVVVTAPLPAAGLELDAITRVDQAGVRRELELERVRVGRDFARAASVHATK